MTRQITIPATTLLDQAINEAGIPIHGLRRVGGSWVIDFKPEATPAQIMQANTIAAGFPLIGRRARTLAAIKNDIDALVPIVQSNLFRVIAAETLQANPKLAQAFGIAVDGDEPDV